MVENCYEGAVSAKGNLRAMSILKSVFKPCDSAWRGLGNIPSSGLDLRDKYSGYDASKRFHVELMASTEPGGCRCGDVLRGIITPAMCSNFGSNCTPESPLGACMVSSEGTCAASFQFDFHEVEE